MTKRVNITWAMVKAAKAPPGTDSKTGHLIHDAEVPGLHLRVFPNGKRTWRLYFRTAAGRQRRMTLEDGLAMTPEAARQMAREILGDVARGKDPQANKAARRQAPTVSELADRYGEEHLPHKKPRSQKEDQRLLRLHVLPELGKLKVEAVTFSDVDKLHRSLKDSPYQANRVLSLTSKLLSLAEQWGWRPQNSNVAHRVQKFREEKRHRELTEPEMARLGQALAEMEATGWNPRATAAIRMLILTGLRRTELLSLRWNQVDLEHGRLHFTDDDSKTGAWSVPLSAAAVAVLDSLPRNAKHVFFSVRTGEHLRDLQKPWRKARDLAGLQGVRIHDLRHSFATFGLGQGVPLAGVGRLLGHRSAATTSRYAGYSDDPARQAAETAVAPIVRALRAGAKAAARKAGSDE
jgi:integrase